MSEAPNGNRPDSDQFSFIAKLEVLKLCDDAARRWLAAFNSGETTNLAKGVFEAMVRFRRHDIEGAIELLDSVDEQLDEERDGLEPAIARILRRWHHSAMAYYHYLEGDMEAAERALDAARDEIKAALETHPFLIPIVTHCIDFRIQRARIARRLNHWAEAHRHMEIVRQIYTDRAPFCTLSDGRQIKISDIRRFYESLPLDQRYIDDLQYALDPSYPHHLWIDRLEENIFALPDFVIPYP